MDQRMSGEITEIFVREGSTVAKVRVDGTYFHVPLFLLMSARVGDTVVIDAGVAVTNRGRGSGVRKALELQ